MSIRPIDVARRLKISTTLLRYYEEIGIIPEVKRSHNGYRIYTTEHIAYFTCIRDMMRGFTLAQITKLLKLVLERQIDDALWMVNKAQVELHNDKFICDKFKQRFLKKKIIAKPKDYSIDAVSKATGIIPSTIRYWDKIGLISAYRSPGNNYRMFTQKQVDEILLIQAFKLSLQAQGEKYAVEIIRNEIHKFNYEDISRISTIITIIENHLSTRNKAQIRSISALFSLCYQVENNCYDVW